jgi:hypothetical protein
MVSNLYKRLLNENKSPAPQSLPIQMPDAGGQMPENVFNPLFSVLCFLASDLCFGEVAGAVFAPAGGVPGQGFHVGLPSALDIGCEL